MAHLVCNGCRIDVNGKAEAFCTAPVNAAAVLAADALHIHPDADVDVVWQASDSDGNTSETTLWSGCGWSAVDFYSEYGMR